MLQYVQVALGREWPSFSFSLAGKHLRMLIHYHNVCIRFDTAEIRRLNRCRISVGYCDKNSRTCGRNVAADSDVEFLSNLIRYIEFDSAEMRRMNRALNSFVN